jgi:hypothetical protein
VFHSSDFGAVYEIMWESMVEQDRPQVTIEYEAYTLHSGFGGLGVSMLASGTQDRGFEPIAASVV